ADLAVRPLLALHPEGGARFHRGCRRDVRVPAVVSGNRLVGHRFVVVNAENYLGPRTSPICLVLAVAREGVARNHAVVPDRSATSWAGGAVNTRAKGPAKIRANSPTAAITPACSHWPVQAWKRVRKAVTVVTTPATTVNTPTAGPSWSSSRPSTRKNRNHN